MSMKMTMAEFVGLEPCPFCGGELRIDWSMSLQYWAYCPNDKCCFYETLIYDSVPELVEACNTRAERTCKDVNGGGYTFVCSECTYELHMPFGWNFGYCPNCGAKVVSE